MESLSIQYPSWYFLFCILLGLAVAAALYFRDRTFREQPGWLTWLLGSFRFLSITLISFFLLSPLLKSLELETRKPVVVVAQDVSESVRNDMSDDEEKAYRDNLLQLQRSLENDYDVQLLSFGSSTRDGLDTAFIDKVSNISNAVQEVKDRYSGTNLGALVLATDGIYNEGSNPLYSSTGLTVPVYTVAMGDTTPKQDLVLKRVFHNRIAYLDDKFSVQIDVTARNLNGRRSTLSVYKVEEGQPRKLQEQTININQNDFFRTTDVILDADVPGVQRFRFTLQPLDGEISRRNNSKDIFVDVLDARQRILILAASPHPDLTAIRQSIRTNKNYEVDVREVDELTEPVTAYDFVILHQLPSQKNGISNLMNQLDQNQVPRLFILGTQSDYRRINAVQSLMSIQATPRNTNDVQGRLNPAFSLFNVDDDLQSALNAYPPLTAAFGEFADAGNGQVLLYQRIREINTDYPLLMMGNEKGTKAGVLTAEGIWKWRLFDYLQNEDHEQFDGFFSKTIQYLSLKEDKRKFRVSMAANILDENEPVLFDAELYNNSYELINGPDVRMLIIDEDGNEYDYTFNKTDKAYRLNAGPLPVGNYQFEAFVNMQGERLSYNGQFSVQPIQLELYETTADHALLRLLSERTGGRMVYPEQLTVLSDSIRAEGSIKPVIYQSSRTRSAINLRWLFILIILLLASEWSLRRYFGGY